MEDQWNVQSCTFQKIMISFVVLVYEIKIILYYFQLEKEKQKMQNSILTPSSVDITSISILWQKSWQPQWNNHQYHHRPNQNDHFHTDCSWPPSGIYHESGSVDTPTHSWHYYHHHHLANPTYGRQSLEGSWGKDTVGQVHYKMFLTSHFAPTALSSNWILLCLNVAIKTHL